MIPTTRYAAASREELWSNGSLLESRLTCGQAVEDAQGIVATDLVDAALVNACDAWMRTLRQFLEPDLRMRLVALASADGTSGGLIVAAASGCSVVTTPSHAPADLRLLRSIASTPPTRQHAPDDVAIVWKRGSGAVLMHEAIGHPLELRIEAGPMPEWLDVDVVLEQRRESFRDVPLVRMRHVRVSQSGAPFALPERRIEIHLVDGGGYDALGDVVSIRVAAADLIEGSSVVRLAPFEIVERRSTLLRAIAGAAGDSIRYPGVICSREGQELFVESFAPDLLMEPL